MNPSFLAALLQASDTQPWFDPQSFGTWFGALGGAGVGILGAFFGGFGGWAAPRGKHRSFVLGGMLAVGVACAFSLVAGLVALTMGQPYGVWYPLTLIGAVGAGCFLGLHPVMRRRYAEAESRRFEADALRRS
jgi:hypothetical protein